MTASDVECYSCRSLSGEKRISPGPIIYTGNHWVVEHAYPCAMLGWLVIVLKRHAEALHELSSAEFSELVQITEQLVQALRRSLHCEKEYVVCFSEAAHFNHIHFHVVGKMADLPGDLKGTAIFRMLQVSEQDAVPPEMVARFCERISALL
jgi:diadenosine tetraphosphate (Ap4A) HIT family hydrolase